VYFLGRLWRDLDGARLGRRLSDNGVRLDHVHYGDDPSTLACVFPPEPRRPDVRYAFYPAGTLRTCRRRASVCRRTALSRAKMPLRFANIA